MRKIVFVLCCVLVGFPVAKANAGENDPGQRSKARQRWREMTPEERKAFREKRQKHHEKGPYNGSKRR